MRGTWGVDWTTVYRDYCYTLGVRPDPVAVLADDLSNVQLLDDLIGTKTRRDAARVLFALALSLETHERSFLQPTTDVLQELQDALEEASALSPTVGIRLVVHEGHHAVVPHGAGFLDEGLVDANLVWLEAYPDAAKSFQDALQTYGEGDRSRYRNVLDNLRFALEQVLKGILANTKSLENQQKVLLPWLKQRGVHEQTVNLFQAVLFGPYSHFQNNAVKHAAEYSEKEVEFYIYQTGTLLRLLLTLTEASYNKIRGPSSESPQ